MSKKEDKTIKLYKSELSFASQELEIVSIVGEDQNKEEFNLKGVAYSGLPIAQHFTLKNLILDVESMHYGAQIPLFFNHDSSNVIGHGYLTKENGQLLIKGKVSDKNEDGKRVIDLSREGLNWQLSVGTNPEYVEKVTAGKKVKVNGLDIEGPAVVFRNSDIFEVSVVPVGADRSTSAEIFAKQVENSEEKEVKQMEKVKAFYFTNEDLENKEVEFENVEVSKMEEEILVPEEMETKFACSCGEKKEKKSFADLKTKIAELEAALKKYKDEEKKKKQEKRFSVAKETFSSIGLTLEETQFSALFASLSDEDFDSQIKVFAAQKKVETKSEKHEELTTPSKEAAEAPVRRAMSPAEVTEEAKRFMKETGETDMIEAIKKVALDTLGA